MKVETSMFPTSQEPASRVWHLPHVRLEVFKCLAADEEDSQLSRGVSHQEAMRSRVTLLQSHLTLNRETSLDVALLLYPDLDLDRFPWICQDEYRRRAYAAGVRYLKVPGSSPLLSQWAGPSELLDFFPNVEKVVFDTQEGYRSRQSTTLVRRTGGAGQPPNILLEVYQAVFVEHGDPVPDPPRFYEPPDLQCEVFRSLMAGWPISHGRPCTVGDRVALPNLFRQPLGELDLRPHPGEQDDWLRMLEQRKSLQLPIKHLRFLTRDGEIEEVMRRLADAAPPELITLVLDIYTAGPLSATLNTIMTVIDIQNFPCLEHLGLTVMFMKSVMPDPGYDGGAEFEAPWMTNNIPPDIHISIVLNISDIDDYPQATWRSLEDSLFESLPLTWIQNVRRKISNEQLSLVTYRDHFKPSQTPSVAARLEHALHGPNEG